MKSISEKLERYVSEYLKLWDMYGVRIRWGRRFFSDIPD